MGCGKTPACDAECHPGQLDERVRYTEAMLATTLAAIKKTAEG